MTKIQLTYTLILTLLFYNIANGIEMVDELGAHHVGSMLHQSDVQASSPHMDDGDDHKTHCCHAHVSNVYSQKFYVENFVLHQQIRAEPRHIKNHILGPPTPPPDV